MAVKERGVTGFTLIELVIAAAIFTALATSVIAGFQSGLFGYRNINRTIDTYRAARLILRWMNQDIRNSFAYRDDDSGFNGTSEELSFFALVDTHKDGKISRDYSFVRYSLDDNKLMRLCRTDTQALNNDSEVPAQEIMAGVTASFAYLYYDNSAQSLKEINQWQGSEGLPAAIKITLAVGAEQFERTVFLPG